MDYANAALRWLGEQGANLQAEAEGDILRLTAPEDLQQRLKYLPGEIRPDNDRFALTTDRQRIYAELKRCRDEDSPWPQLQYLWPLHPVMEWLADRALNAFGRHTAPVIRLPQQLAADAHWVLVQGGFPNRRGHVHIQAWCAVQLRAGQVVGHCNLPALLQQLPLVQLANTGVSGDTEALQNLLPLAVTHARMVLQAVRDAHEDAINYKLNHQLAELETLKQRHIGQLELDLGSALEAVKQKRREERLADIDRVFTDYLNWLENTQCTEPHPYLQVVAVFTGSQA
jgi:hypothetical protein